MKSILIISALLLQMNSFGQLNVYSGAAHQMMTSDFLGANYQISNVQFTGAVEAIGSFEASGTTIGLQTGIVLTTGRVLGTSGPTGPNNQSNAGIDNSNPGYLLLAGQTNGAQNYNAAVLEFDFVPLVDTFNLKYVFGSEEYPEFAPPNNSSYNDVFGFFISGPGIPGIQNIAKLPAGSIVSINNVNPVTNSGYYVYNGIGTDSPFHLEDQYIQYDGFTVVLEAKADVQIGGTYHLIIAIADVGDGIYDSGIFLESCEGCAFYAQNETIVNEQEITIFPNPAKNELTIQNNSGSTLVCEFVDLSGKVLEKHNFQFQSSSINTSVYPNGMYFLRISNDVSITMYPIMVQH